MPAPRRLAVLRSWGSGARARLAVALALVALAMLALRDLVVGARFPFFGDLRFTHHPLIHDGARQGGRWPLWCDHVFNGYPIFADAQAAQYYPPTWLVHLLGAPAGLSAFIVLHVVIAALGTAAWLRGHGLGVPAQMTGAMVFALSGAFLSTAVHLGLFATIAWVPLWLAAIHRVAEAPSSTSISIAGLALAASILAGGPQLLAAAVLLTGVYGVALWIRRRDVWRGRALLARIAAVAAAVAVAVGVSAIALLPQLEFLPHSQRSIGLEPEFAARPSLAPHALWRLLLGPTLPRPDGVEVDPLELYLGAVALVLALAGLVTALRRGQRREHAAIAGAMAAFALVTLAAALGPALPVFRGLVAVVPGFGYFRAPSRLACVAGIALAYLAALGLDLWIRGAIDRRWIVGISIVAVAAPALALALSPTYGGELAAALALPIVGIGLVALAVGERHRARVGALIVVVTAIDLALLAGPRSPIVALSPSEAPTAAALEGRELRSLDVLAGRIADPLAGRVIIAAGYGHGTYNYTMLRGLDGVSGYNGSSLLRFTDLMHLIETGRFYPRTGLYRDEIALKPRRFDTDLVDLLAAPYLVTRSDPKERRWRHVRRVVADQRPELLLFNTRALPRAYLSARTIVRPHPRAAREAALLALDPRARPSSRTPRSPSTAPPTIAPCDLERPRSEHLIARCEAETPALLVIADAYYPGWEARVDGSPAAIHAANHAFRGILVGPGAHTVELGPGPGAPRDRLAGDDRHPRPPRPPRGPAPPLAPTARRRLSPSRPDLKGVSWDMFWRTFPTGPCLLRPVMIASRRIPRASAGPAVAPPAPAPASPAPSPPVASPPVAAPVAAPPVAAPPVVPPVAPVAPVLPSPSPSLVPDDDPPSPVVVASPVPPEG
ncbi:MAG: hypothetical protein R3B09_04960 [Nannocystaceae bacterium]